MQQSEDLFHAALDQGPEFLDWACRDNPELKREVQELVDSYREWSAAIGPAPEVELPAFGPYQCDSILGSGGMGTVYRAHRSDGQFTQQVAIKVLRGSLRSDWFRQRFLLEREILARLNHPGIARLFDGGATAGGEPYLVMELVEGESIDRYCRGLGVDARLRLILQVMDAVDYAHRALIVHRDLKPGNILVTAEGRVKLLDFGTSKLVNAEADVTAAPSLSPAYASPEQLQGRPVTTSSDVYSLGVVLYELLSGHSPFGANGSWALALWRATASPLIPQPSNVSAELWSILAKALEADPNARYQAPRDMAADIERYLDGHPVLARPAGFSYRAGKFVQRNRLAVAGAAALLIALAGGIGTTLWQARKAQRRFEDLRQYARYVVTDLHTGIQRLPGSTELQRESVERSLQYLDRLAAESTGDDPLTLEVADAYRRLANILGNPYRPNLGKRAEAQEIYRKALALAASAKPSAASSRIQAEAKIQLAGTSGFGGAREAGLVEIRQSAEILRSLAVADPADADLNMSAAVAFEVLGTRLTGTGGMIGGAGNQEAARAYRQSASIAEKVLARHPAHQGAIRQLSQCELSQAVLLGSDDPLVALTHDDRALQWLDRLPPSANDADTLRFRATVLSNIGWAEGQAGKHAEAIVHLEEAAAILHTWTTTDPANTNVLYALTGAIRALGIVEDYRRGTASSVGHFEHAASLHSRLLERDPGNKVYTFLRAELLIRAANGNVDLRKSAKAQTQAREGLQLLHRLADAPNPSASHLFGACRWFSETKVASERDPVLAAKYCRLAEAATKGQDPDAYSGLAKALALTGNKSGAIEALKRALSMIPKTPSGAAPSRQRIELEAEMPKLLR